MNRVPVVHIISGDLWAGPENQLVTLLSSMRHDERFAVRVIVLNQGVLVERLKELGVPVVVVEERGRSFFALVRAVAAELGKLDMSIIHSHRYKENILAALVSRRAKSVVLIQTVHGVTEIFSGLKAFRARTYLGLNRFATRRAFDRVIAVSDEIRLTVQEELGSRPLVVTIRNGVELDRLQPTGARAAVRRALGIPESAPVIGMIGRLVAVKSIETMLEAMVEIRRAHPELQLVLAGEGPEAGALRAKAKALGVGGAVQFLGNRSDIPQLLEAIDMLVISSLHEGIPTVLLEALAMECAVVSTAVGGIPEVVTDGVHGLLVRPGDVAALAAKCSRLLGAPGERARLGREGRARIEAEFSAEVLGRRVGDLYAELFARHQPSRQTRR